MNETNDVTAGATWSRRLPFLLARLRGEVVAVSAPARGPQAQSR